jgi:aryl-alcohol dehydrogenase-like predicted oxidoreductase
MWNLLYRDVEREIVPTCARIGAEIVPWFPLAGGLLTGKYARGAPFPPHTRFGRMPERIGFMASEQAFDRIDGLATVADEADVTMAELSIAWLAQQPSVHSVIAGAMNADQLEHSVHAQSVTLSPETLAAIDEICAQESCSDYGRSLLPAPETLHAATRAASAGGCGDPE